VNGCRRRRAALAGPGRIKRAPATELTPEIAALVIGLVARDDVGREALAALCTIALRCTGMVVDALLDPVHEVIIRRRLPPTLRAGLLDKRSPRP
jgi:hypothetical protein